MCDIFILNDDVLRYICDFIDSNEYIFLNETCRKFYTFFKEQKMSIVFPETSYLFSDSKYLKWGEEYSYKINKKNMYKQSIFFGNDVSVLDYIKDNFDDSRKFLTTKVFYLASLNGEINKLNWLKKNRCPYDKSIVESTIYSENKLYKWVTKKCIWTENQIYDLIKKDDLKTLKWAVKSVPKLSEYVCDFSSELNNMKILKWGIKNKFKCGYIVCSNAAKCGNLEMLKFLRKNKCRWNDWTITEAAGEGHFDIVKWCVENKCKMNEYTCADAAANNHLDILIYLRENKCPWDNNTYISAIDHPKVFKYVLDNNCPSENQY